MWCRPRFAANRSSTTSGGLKDLGRFVAKRQAPSNAKPSNINSKEIKSMEFSRRLNWRHNFVSLSVSVSFFFDFGCTGEHDRGEAFWCFLHLRKHTTATTLIHRWPSHALPIPWTRLSPVTSWLFSFSKTSWRNASWLQRLQRLQHWLFRSDEVWQLYTNMMNFSLNHWRWTKPLSKTPEGWCPRVHDPRHPKTMTGDNEGGTSASHEQNHIIVYWSLYKSKWFKMYQDQNQSGHKWHKLGVNSSEICKILQDQGIHGTKHRLGTWTWNMSSSLRISPHWEVIPNV